MADVSVQAWSAVWRLPTTLGPVVVKQTTAGRAAEIAVHAACARFAPEFVSPPLATDVAGHRLLLCDGGPTLDQHHPAIPPTLATDLIRDYASFQRATAEHRGDLLAAGCPTWDPAAAADELESLVTALTDLPTSDLRHLTAAQRDVLLDNRQAYRRAGATLAASALPECLDHGDLWPGSPVSSRQWTPTCKPGRTSWRPATAEPCWPTPRS